MQHGRTEITEINYVKYIMPRRTTMITTIAYYRMKKMPEMIITTMVMTISESLMNIKTIKVNSTMTMINMKATIAKIKPKTLIMI